MASAALARDARELSFRSTDGLDAPQSRTLTGALSAAGPVYRHSSPHVLILRRSPIQLVLTQGRKDEVYGRVSFREPCSRLLPCALMPPACAALVNHRGTQARNCPSAGP